MWRTTRDRKFHGRGFTLAEFAVASTLSFVITLTLTSLFLLVAALEKNMITQVRLEKETRSFLNLIRDKIQFARLVSLAPGGTELTIEDFDGNEEKFAIAGGEMRHFADAALPDYSVLLANTPPESAFEVTTFPNRLQMVHVLTGIRDPFDQDGKNYFYVDVRISARVPLAI